MGKRGRAGTRLKREARGTMRSASLGSEGFLEEVTFRLRSEVRAGHEMKSRRSTSGEERGSQRPEWRSGDRKTTSLVGLTNIQLGVLCAKLSAVLCPESCEA